MNISQIWAERRKIILVGLLSVLLIILLARQSDFIPPSPAGRVVRTIFSPLVSAVAVLDRTVSYGWMVAFRGVDLEKENRALRQEVALLKVANKKLIEAHAQLERLAKLMPNMTANVVGKSPNFWAKTVTIDRGRRDGIAADMPVVNQDGLVGIVRDVTEKDALVQLLIDPQFAAGAQVRETRDRGVVEGTGEADRLLLVLESPQTSLQVGHEVMTSGWPVGSLFPKGYAIGTIQGIEKGMFLQPYIVKPTVRFDRLEEVVVLMESRRSEGATQQLPVPPP